MALRLTGLLVFLAALATSSALADEWSRDRIRRLPDWAFAVVETSPEGRKGRHLPHHDETGAVDSAHLRAALARLSQVKWLDPTNESVARRHLESHLREERKLTQAQLAKRIGTHQSAIARMEQRTYRGYTVATLAKIAAAAGKHLEVRIVSGARRVRHV